jgi:hypothetical protein
MTNSMVTPMVERVARAICQRENSSGDCKACRAARYRYNPETKDEEYIELQVGCLGLGYKYLADVAIQAMREPTDEMCEVGFAEACKHDSGDSAPALEIAPATFRAMIDAALK